MLSRAASAKRRTTKNTKRTNARASLAAAARRQAHSRFNAEALSRRKGAEATRRSASLRTLCVSALKEIACGALGAFVLFVFFVVQRSFA
jgi:hypothetical protein